MVNTVHTTGVFKHKVRWCQCQSAPKKTVQLFQPQLFPASHLQPETAFTFDVLDHFHIDAMECKTAAASFIKKLCRLTNNAFPHVVPNRERELCQVSRQWHDLQSRKWLGFGHDVEKTPQNGNLAHYCPACPQPGINLPDDWNSKSAYHNYRAMNLANLDRKNRDATGIGACACARHGCFVPHTVVDFQKGGRYAFVSKGV
ncbi:hypothetical protein DFH94DRAFT_796350 [Russula ochroleuca]|uniref:CxC2-like cysteine cluster KDZ transposase-associated domain-containing protein n=1 Tax=Russula ochroleuca TaxID=152965 RepID=A0A9P5JTR4_9AGAM|nr:hypothetical protein DFH94DRAFT_796350 [Russula ochroleuca]